MPTLIEVPIDASMESNDDRESRHRQEPHQDTFVNESTRLFDETVLGNDSMDTSQRGPYDEDNHHGNDDSFVDNDETRLDVDATTLNGDDAILNIARQMESRKNLNKNVTEWGYEKPEPAKRTVGPKEEHYTRHFERYVTHVISDFEHQYPDKVRDYRSMSQSEKEREKNRVSALLSRLGGSSTTVLHCRARIENQVAPAEMAETSGESSATRLSENHSDGFTQQSNPESAIHTAPDSDSPLSQLSRDHVNDDDLMTGECNQSSALLSSESPQTEVDELAARLDQSMALMSPSSDVVMSPTRYSQHQSQQPSQQQQSQQLSQYPQQHDSDDDSSAASSVEIVRRTASAARSTPSSQMYESPTITTNRMKRMASASGKRGTDQSRMKLDEDSFASFDASIVRPSDMIASPSQLVCSSIKSAESPLFHASQSPIDDAFSSAEKVNRSTRTQSQSSRRLEIYEDEQLPTNQDDTLQSLDVTNNHRRTVRWNEESFLQEIPANVHLKENAPFRMKPLRVGRPSRREAEEEGRHRQVAVGSIPDPLRNYEGILRKKVKAAYAWMKEKDTLSDAEDENGGMLFSMCAGQIIDVTMKLCIKHKSNHNLKDIIEGEVLNGGTLIVARTKEDLDDWQSSLRECTTFSVLNHALMPAEDRKRTSSANRCAGYDVVVTTFDALKSKDIATPLNSRGYVIHEKIGFQDGWYSARSNSSQTGGHNEQLSVLHQINWRRVIFVDTLGRKSFAVKQGTARANAAIAISASSRFLFFPAVPNDKTSAVDALAKSDKKSFKSVAAVLHLGDDAAVGGSLSDSMFDMNDVKAKPTNRSRR